MSHTLVYDIEKDDSQGERLLKLVEKHSLNSVTWQDFKLENIPSKELLILYLSDNQIKELLPSLESHQITIAALPHPDAERICKTMGVDSNLQKAIEHAIESEKTLDFDILYCNGNPIFSNVVIGSSFQVVTSNLFKKIGFWSKIKSLFIVFFKVKPFAAEITRNGDNTIRTTISGGVISTHKTNSLITGFIPESSAYDDGLFHLLLVSPRSIFQLISYAFNSLWESNKLPRFGAHIKTGSCVLKNPEGVFNYTEDGDRKSNQELRFELKKKMLSAIPGEHLDLKNTSHSTNEIFKIQALPRGESARELSKSQLPLIKRASTEEFKDLFQVLRENAELRTTYLVLMVLSTTLATFGLFADSTPVVIGAMILAPLMSPIISLSMGALRQDKNLIFSSTNTILTGLGISILFAIFITLITPIKNPNSEILSRTNPNLLDLGIAVISGIAGAYAHAREEVAKTLAGVAIAVALVPPLAVAGIGLGWMDWSVFSGALLLLLTNLAGMVLAASVTFMLLGFSPFRLATKAVFLSLVLVGAFSVPLGLGFNRMVYKHKVIQNLNGLSIGDITIKDVSVQSVKPLTISIRIVANERVDNDKLREIKNQIEEKLNNEVELEITTSMKF